MPEALLSQWQQKWEHFEGAADSEDVRWLAEQCDQSPQFQQELQRIWACSDFVANSCITQPQLLKSLINSDALNQPLSQQQFADQLQSDMAAVSSDDELLAVLRRFRQRQMVRIVWRDLIRKASMTETTADMSALAEVILQAALGFLYKGACEKWGVPYDAEGNQQFMVVLGMGKLGAHELNVSSDIDLIFSYPEAGKTLNPQSGGKTLSNQEFFIRLGQKLIKALDARTADGFVFRVDMRLRPYGQSGALVLNFDAMEEYYQTQGRDWERYAMIKARVVAGDSEAGERLMSLLRPFTYRKYIDFSAIEALREMKALINREVQRTGMDSNIKRGAGGIREVEFIAQAFQIIRGGRDRRFQQPGLLNILQLLDELELLMPGEAGQLAEAYTFLRNVEHAVQGWQDKQTQSLPDDAAGQQRLAFLMGAGSWEAFTDILNKHRQVIRAAFDHVIAAPQSGGENEAHESECYQQAVGLWQQLQLFVNRVESSTHADDQSPLLAVLASLDYDLPEEALERLTAFVQGKAVIAMPASTRSRLDALMPRLINECGNVPNSAEALTRILPLIEAVIRRSAYLLLLVENPRALQSLVVLSAASVWIAGELALHPALLDELLDRRSLYSLPAKEDLEDELRQQMLRVPEDDLEAQMDTLRYFRRSHALRVAACEIEGTLPLMKVSDYLTWMAEAILKMVYELSWAQLVARYGRPVGVEGGEAEFLIVGYGKLGGIELGHGSDLDMVFIYDAQPNSQTKGERSVDVATFFTRLGQRIIHFLTAQTPAGSLYEADMRLRPSGNSGMLVSTVAAFEKYQQDGAWMWEHQALVRARPIAGSPQITQKFEEVRCRVLQQSRDTELLREEVRAMREKMRAHLGSKPARDDEPATFHLKQDRGGIVDIEFLVQYQVLLNAHSHPELTVYTDNVRILEAVAELKLMPLDDVKLLKQAYIFYRSLGHRLNLQGQDNMAELGQLEGYPEQVAAIWHRVMEVDAAG